MTEEERKKRVELKKQNAQKYRQRFADLRDLITRERKETIELMRCRHAHYTKLINDANVKTAQEFYNAFKDYFEMYGINLELSDDKKSCSIYLELGDYDYERYYIEDSQDDNLAVVSPNVAFKEMFADFEINIFTEEEL